MPGLFANGLTALKERALETILQRLINQKIQAFGSVTRLQIDSRQRTVLAQLDLKGEPSSIELKVGSYEVVEEQGAVYLSVQNLQSSKEWLGLVLNEYVAGRKFQVPAIVKKAL